ncbi:MAG: hypothetical protein U0L51_09585, partial [Olegusella sp.]|nr:hypothetical protein [Olegusella sp.]
AGRAVEATPGPITFRAPTSDYDDIAGTRTPRAAFLLNVLSPSSKRTCTNFSDAFLMVRFRR